MTNFDNTPARFRKYYVVWAGHSTGIFDSWEECKAQISGFPGAKYRSFPSQEEAVKAYRGCPQDHLGLMRAMAERKTTEIVNYEAFPEIRLNAIAVDGACAGNPGKMEYRGVELMTGRELFHVGPFEQSTNNIGEFLAIVHALSLMFQRGERHTIYSDSVTGMAWVRNRKVKTQLTRNSKTEKSFQLMERALSWLNTHTVDVKIRKWDTDRWGEIPADFGRK